MLEVCPRASRRDNAEVFPMQLPDTSGLETLHKEWPVIRAAPYSFAISVVIVCMIIGGVIYLLFRSRFDRLNETIEHQDRQIARLREEAGQAPVSTDAAVNTKPASGLERERPVDPPSLQQRALALAQRVRQFAEKHGPRPTLARADGERTADYVMRLIAKTQPWDDTISGDYYGFLFRPIQQIRGELAQKGLIDSRLDDNFRIERPNEENLRAIVEGLRFLASKLDG
jgi:hypothetical protein